MTPSDASDGGSPSHDEFIFLREEIRHQDNLINARLSWLVSSQSFLLVGFAAALNGSAQALPPINARVNALLVAALPLAGIVTVFASYLTIWAAISRMIDIRRLAGSCHYSHLPSLQATARTRRLGLSGPILTPVVFFLLWLAIILVRRAP